MYKGKPIPGYVFLEHADQELDGTHIWRVVQTSEGPGPERGCLVLLSPPEKLVRVPRTLFYACNKADICAIVVKE